MDKNGIYSQHDMDYKVLLTQISTKLDILINAFDNHIQDDKIRFSAIDKELFDQKKIYFIGCGFIVAIDFILKFYKF